MLTRNLEHILQETITVEDIFISFEKERQEWEPQAVIKNKLHPHQDEIDRCFSRCIALACLELPVGSFIRAIVDQDNIPITAKQGLIKNIQDEEKHELAFRKIAQAYPSTDADMYQANKFRIACVQSKANPLIKSRDLETIVFISLQSFMRYYGSESLERVIGFISRDEYRHLNYNWEVSLLTNCGFDTDFEELLMSINKWLFAPLKNTALNGDFWLDCSQDMREEGKSKRLEELFSYGVHLAPFEISNSYY